MYFWIAGIEIVRATQNRGNEVHVAGRKAKTQRNRVKNSVQNGADRRSDQTHSDVFRTENGFADDDAGQTENEHAGTAGNVCEVLELREHGAGKTDECVGQPETEKFHTGGVDRGRADHLFVVAAGAKHKTQVGFKEKSQKDDDQNDNRKQNIKSCRRVGKERLRRFAAGRTG